MADGMSGVRSEMKFKCVKYESIDTDLVVARPGRLNMRMRSSRRRMKCVKSSKMRFATKSRRRAVG